MWERLEAAGPSTEAAGMQTNSQTSSCQMPKSEFQAGISMARINGCRVVPSTRKGESRTRLSRPTDSLNGEPVYGKLEGGHATIGSITLGVGKMHPEL